MNLLRAVPSIKQQRGAAFIVMLVIMVLGVTTVLLGSISGYALRIERGQITAMALARAKEALISYAVNSENAGGMQPRPGDLPCPDTDAPGTANYGDENTPCTSGKIGRLPWKTLGIPELTDESGEPLWYAISGNFRTANSNPNPINSDTAGTLSVYDNDGTTLLTANAAAVVFAPGRLLGAQQRGTNAQKTVPSNYLDASPNPNSRDNAAGPFIAANESPAFNDSLLFITTGQLMLPVEKRVAGVLKNLLATYFTAWGGYPFAATFGDPADVATSYKGVTATFNGLAPLGGLNGIGSYTYPRWNATPSITFSGPGSGGSYGDCQLNNGRNPDGVSVADGRWSCDNIWLPAGRTVTITGTLSNVGKGFWKLHEISDTGQVRVKNSSGTTLSPTALLGVLNPVSVTGSLNNDGSATVTFRGTAVVDVNMDSIELRDMKTYQSLLPIWFPVNNWHQVMYYAVSPGYAPGANACLPLPDAPSCLTVNGSGGGNNKRALVIMTGGALANPHPSNNLLDYLEGQNATPDDFIYENQNRSNLFNDQVIVVSP